MVLGRLKGAVKRVLGREEPPRAAPPPPRPTPIQRAPAPLAPAAAVAHAEAAKTTEDVHAGREPVPQPEPVAELSPPPPPPAPEPPPEPPRARAPEETQTLAERALALAKAKKAAQLIHADMGSTDIEHYRARAIANGRGLESITGGEGMNEAADGERYWGPVDNESSRAKAAGKLVSIDQWECISCGTCVEQTDKVFYLPTDGKATPIAQDGPMDLIQDAIEACPVTCIHWVTPDEAKDRGLATGEGE